MSAELRSGRREDRGEAIEQVREEDEQLDQDALRHVLEQSVRMLGDEPAERDDQPERQERERKPACCPVAPPVPLHEGNDGKGHIDDRVDDAKDGDDGVQRCPRCLDALMLRPAFDACLAKPVPVQGRVIIRLLGEAATMRA